MKRFNFITILLILLLSSCTTGDNAIIGTWRIVKVMAYNTDGSINDIFSSDETYWKEHYRAYTFKDNGICIYTDGTTSKTENYVYDSKTNILILDGNSSEVEIKGQSMTQTQKRADGTPIFITKYKKD